jgi:hypothetical protein
MTDFIVHIINRTLEYNNKDNIVSKFFVGLHGDKTYNTIVCGNTT